MAPALWVLAVISTITVIHRIKYTYEQSTAMEAQMAAAGQLQKPERVVIDGEVSYEKP
jgi:hypothetical protein